MTVQTFIPSAVKAASENTVTQPTHTTDVSIKSYILKRKGVR
jgi:tRNA-2-methylthio-N6-dimethylallyladenosine synthase